MTVQDFLSKVQNCNSAEINVNIYDANGLLLISFINSGYKSIGEQILSSAIEKITLSTIAKIRIDLASTEP